MAVMKYWNGTTWIEVGDKRATIDVQTSEPGYPIVGQLWMDTDDDSITPQYSVSTFTLNINAVTLPSTPTAGDIYELVGDGTVWTITAYTGQYIRLLSNESSIAGSVSGQTGWESITLMYIGLISAHPTWTVKSYTGTVILS